MCALTFASVLVIIVYASTGAADPVFRVNIFSTNYQSLDENQVNVECSIKDDILNRISEMTTAQGRSDWIGYFKRLVESDQHIVRSLNVHISHVNGDILNNVASLHSNGMISDASWNTIRTELVNYLQFLDGFDFSDILWNRTFVGNPFENILTRLKSSRFTSLNFEKLKTTFEVAYGTVEKARRKILNKITKLKQDIEEQRVNTRQVVVELDELNDDLLTFGTECEQSAKQTNKLIKALRIVSKSVKKLEKSAPVCFVRTMSGKVQLTNELEAIESAHERLNDAIAAL